MLGAQTPLAYLVPPIGFEGGVGQRVRARHVVERAERQPGQHMPDDRPVHRSRERSTGKPGEKWKLDATR